MIRNGVDVDKMGAMLEAVKRDPKAGALRFSMRSEWKGGLSASHAAGQYTVGTTTSQHRQRRTVTTDEPPEVLGADGGVSPAEMTLAALGSCLMVGYSANAAAMGIDLESVTIDLVGSGDLRGFMNVPGARPGLDAIEVSVDVKANAPKAKLQELHDYVNAHSPIWDTLANPVRVSSHLKGGGS